MIRIFEFDGRPISAGEKRRLVLEGEGPFMVTTSCFVDTPPPPGHRRCLQCFTRKVKVGAGVDIRAGRRFWKDKRGRINIDIKNAIGETMHIELTVTPKAETTPRRVAV